ncbi:MAG: protein-L-isoaspartate(D-aspartate) O-methyltransferase [Theionarchaea archaeon]|nr:protein-L-isoaspartate(D-aspartate) O-methyltransferase [Theionarchaea archaeon]
MGQPDYGEMRGDLVDSLVSSGYICTESVRRAFLAVPREEFVPNNLRDRAYVDAPLPIGHGQTISAPSMIAIMLEKLDLKPGQKVLEIGSGSGYNAVLLYEMVERTVITVERLPEMVELAKSNIKATGYEGRVEVIAGDGTIGYPAEEPYDRILVTAGAPKIPQPLVEQLDRGGILGIPVGRWQGFQNFVAVVKDEDGSTREVSHGGCAFVPLIGKHGW